MGALQFNVSLFCVLSKAANYAFRRVFFLSITQNYANYCRNASTCLEIVQNHRCNQSAIKLNMDKKLRLKGVRRTLAPQKALEHYNNPAAVLFYK